MGPTWLFFLRKQTLFILLLGLILSFLYVLFPTRPEMGVLQYYHIDKKILIDAGHGGKDPGANYGPILEKDITLAIARELKKKLKENNITGILTRKGDYLLVEGPIWKDLQARAQVGKEEEVDLLVSIHVNNYVSSLCSGGQVFYNPREEKSRILAQSIQEEIYTIQAGNTRSILPGENLYLLNALPIPSVLVEVGFIKNPGDREFLTSPQGQKEMARVIKNGILRYFLEELGDLSPMEGLIPEEIPPYTPYQEALLYFIEEESMTLQAVPVSLPFNREVPFAAQQVSSLLLQLLLQGPPEGMGLFSPFAEGQVLDIAFQGGDLVVTLCHTIKEDFPGGSHLEELMVLSMKKTLRSIPPISRVFLQLEGEDLGSIGGHILLPLPCR